MLLFQLEAAETYVGNIQFCEQTRFDYEKISPLSFCAFRTFLLLGFKL